MHLLQVSAAVCLCFHRNAIACLDAKNRFVHGNTEYVVCYPRQGLKYEYFHFRSFPMQENIEWQEEKLPKATANFACQEGKLRKATANFACQEALPS